MDLLTHVIPSQDSYTPLCSSCSLQSFEVWLGFLQMNNGLESPIMHHGQRNVCYLSKP